MLRWQEWNPKATFKWTAVIPYIIWNYGVSVTDPSATQNKIIPIFYLLKKYTLSINKVFTCWKTGFSAALNFCYFQPRKFMTQMECYNFFSNQKNTQCKVISRVMVIQHSDHTKAALIQTLLFLLENCTGAKLKLLWRKIALEKVVSIFTSMPWTLPQARI